MPETRPVMVGVDGSCSALATVDLAVAEAVRRRATLLIVHVWPGRYTGVFRSRNAVPSPADGRRLLDLAARRARIAGPGLPVRTELLEGGAPHVLADSSGRARLLVLGHRDAPLTRSSWGSTAAHLARDSVCPLLVNRGAAHDGPVVVAVSGRASAAATVRYAFAEAAVRGSGLVAVHMWARPGTADRPAPAVVPGGYGKERRAATKNLADALDTWAAQFPGVPVERLVVSDLDMAYTIERASRRGRLLVAGIGRRGRFAELLYATGGPATPGLRTATCPVALVPAGWRAAAVMPAYSGPAEAGPR